MPEGRKMSDEYQEFEQDFRVEGGGSSNLGTRLINMLTLIIGVGIVMTIAVAAYLILVPDNFISDVFDTSATDPPPTMLAEALPPTPRPTNTDSPTETPVPADTPTNTRVMDLPPTLTPAAQPEVETRAPVNTVRPSLTPSPTSTLPPPTPTRTPTPTPTDTPTPGPSPTATSTRSAFPFTKDLVSPQYLQNFANSAGCNWLGLAGEVFDIDGNPVGHGAYRVHVWDSGVDARVTVGDSPSYGPSGYEQFLFDAPRVQEHNVQLETENGTAVSQVFRIQTRASCNQNLVYLVFTQNH
jgi:hypothetical protein